LSAPARIAGQTSLIDRQLGGCPIHAGQRVLVLLDAANRAPVRFHDPERFDITRTPRARKLHLIKLNRDFLAMT
jgi:cytochrome P450